MKRRKGHGNLKATVLTDTSPSKADSLESANAREKFGKGKWYIDRERPKEFRKSETFL